MKRIIVRMFAVCSMVLGSSSVQPHAGAAKTHKKPPALRWPIHKSKFWISSYYGTKERKRLHAGLDLAALKGTIVRAAASGVVEESHPAGRYGNMVLVRHCDTYQTRYAHLDKMLVKKGERVVRGQMLGHVGNTGNVSGKNGDHLHFEVLAKNEPINPIKLLA